MTRERAVSYWLLPQEADAAPFKRVIETLTTESGSKAFEPHLTLGTLRAAAPSLMSTLRILKAMTLDPIGIDGTEVFTTSLFVRLSPSTDLSEARKAFERLPGFRQGRGFDPHVSLHYGTPPKGSMQRSEVRSLLDRPIRFDRLVAVSVELPITRTEHLETWVALETYELPAV